MEGDLAKTTADEEAAAKGFADLKASKEAEAAAASEAIKTKTSRSGELAVTVVQTQDDIEDSSEEVADNEKFLAGLNKACPEKEREWAAREKGRAEEIAAISEAIGILNDDDALDVFKKAVPASLIQPQLGLLQTRRGTSASQLRKVQALVAELVEGFRKP